MEPRSTFTLDLLGQTTLRGPDDEATRAVLRQPKRLALLAYLACAGPRCARDTLLPLFWPELPGDRARAALRKALHFLRAHLGSEVIRGHARTHVELDSDAVACDVPGFRRALDDGDPARAVSLYRGPLLSGFFVDDAPGFERWLELERARLTRAAHEAALILVHRSADRAKPDRALFWARRAQRIRPRDGETVRLVATLLDELGRPGAALEECERLEEWIDRELGAPPPAAIRELMEGIRGRASAGSPDPEAPDRPAGEPPLFREIVETASDLVFRTDLDGYYTYVNPAMSRLLGYARRELMGSPHLDFVQEAYRDRLHAFYLRQVQERTARTHCEVPAVDADGETVWLEQVVQLVERDGEPVALQGVARDVSVRKSREEAQRGLATEDRATGLPNERGFRILAEDRLRFARQEESGLVLAVVQVEGANGGPALRRMAEALGASVRHADLLARTGPATFAGLVVTDSEEEAEVFRGRFAERVPHHWSRLELDGSTPRIETHVFRNGQDVSADHLVAILRGRG